MSNNKNKLSMLESKKKKKTIGEIIKEYLNSLKDIKSRNIINLEIIVKDSSRIDNGLLIARYDQINKSLCDLLPLDVCEYILYYYVYYFLLDLLGRYGGKLQPDMKKIANIIGEWYLECKYNPKYFACRRRLYYAHHELYF